MKVYFTHHKEVEDWCIIDVDFPDYFDVRVRKGDVFVPYETLLEEWINSRKRSLSNNLERKNIEVDMVNRKIYYEDRNDDVIEVTDIFEVESIKELVKLMRKHDCEYFVESDKNWRIE